MCAEVLRWSVSKVVVCSGLALAAVEPQASDRKLYASAVDVDPWTTCEKLAETASFRGLSRTVYRDGQFACEGESRGHPIGAATVCQRQLGLSRSGVAVRAVVSVDAASRPLFVRCLYEEVDASYLTPTKERPDWPRPVFASATDDRCDIYRRGPVPEPPRNMQVREKSRIDLSAFTDAESRTYAAQILQQQQRALAEVQIQPARLLPLLVANTLFDDSGEPVQSPVFPLRRVLDHRPTIAVTWWPGCHTCDEVIRLLHEQDPFYFRQGTAHPTPRLAILFPTKGNEQDQKLRQQLRRQFPGRASWAVIAGFQFALVNARQQPLPQLLVFDAHGLMRASTFASAFDHPEAAGWTLVREPALLLNAALEEGHWQDVPRQATLEEVARELARGRLAGGVREAPDVIRLDPTVAGAMSTLGRRGKSDRREYGAPVLLDRTAVRLGNPTAGGTGSVHVVEDPADFRSIGDRVGCTTCSGDVVRIGIFHTHPTEVWHSPLDLRNSVVWGLNVVAMPSGTLVMTLSTHERLKAFRSVHSALRDPQIEVYERPIRRTHFDPSIVGVVDAAPADFSAAMPIRHWAAAVPDLEQPAVNYAALVAGYARVLGLAIYVGHGDLLYKVTPPGDTSWVRAWTGADPAKGQREEIGLSEHERIIIARMVRSLLGDRDAFCATKSADIRPVSTQADRWVWTFTPEVRDLIRAAADEAARRYPDWPPLNSARQGYLDDQDLPYLLELVGDEVEMRHGSFMHRENRRCLLKIYSYNRGGGRRMSDLGSILAWGRAERRSGHVAGEGDIYDLQVAEDGFQGTALGTDARHFGCANAALFEGSPFADAAGRGKTTCDRLLRQAKQSN